MDNENSVCDTIIIVYYNIIMDKAQIHIRIVNSFTCRRYSVMRLYTDTRITINYMINLTERVEYDCYFQKHDK